VPKQYYHGKVIGYNIIYYPVDLESDFNFVSVNYTTNTTTLKDLAVYTMYVINVSAVSSGGVGPAIMAITRTDAEGEVVLKIVLNLKILFQEERSTSLVANG